MSAERCRPIALEIDNDIPIGKGLGSSAAALTAGVVIADHLLGLHWKPLRILDEAARIEGHPDNVAACVLGSIVASAMDPGGVARAVRLELPARYGVACRGARFYPAHRPKPAPCCPTPTRAKTPSSTCSARALLIARARHRHHQRISRRARRSPASALSRRAGAGPR